MSIKKLAVVCGLMGLLLGLSSAAAAETVWVDVGLPGEAPAFHFERAVSIGGTTQMAFEHEGKGYRVLIKATERSAAERSSTGLTTPKFEVFLYRGGVAPERLMAKAEVQYPAGSSKASCEVHVEPGMPEGFWLSLGVGLGESPGDACQRMMKITQQMQKK